ncbi:MAG TPA: DUF2530 domain-containing protein [Marmoricola sp.]|nr:DUF2530 domain-containing protein [Marmoricola sp.]
MPHEPDVNSPVEHTHHAPVFADVEPLDVDGVRTVTVGTAIWLIGFVGLLPFYGSLKASGNQWWLWTCAAGVGLGLWGWVYCSRRRRIRLGRETDR